MTDSSEFKKSASGDIAFLVKKEFDGKLVRDDNEKDGVTGNAAILTASTGKDLYLAKAKIIVFNDNISNSGTVTVTLKLNGVIKETWAIGNVAPQGVGDGILTFQFNTQGFKVAATQTITIDVTVASAIVHVRGNLLGFEADTGVDPLI